MRNKRPLAAPYDGLAPGGKDLRRDITADARADASPGTAGSVRHLPTPALRALLIPRASLLRRLACAESHYECGQCPALHTTYYSMSCPGTLL